MISIKLQNLYPDPKSSLYVPLAHSLLQLSIRFQNKNVKEQNDLSIDLSQPKLVDDQNKLFIKQRPLHVQIFLAMP